MAAPAARRGPDRLGPFGLPAVFGVSGTGGAAQVRKLLRKGREHFNTCAATFRQAAALRTCGSDSGRGVLVKGGPRGSRGRHCGGAPIRRTPLGRLGQQQGAAKKEKELRDEEPGAEDLGGRPRKGPRRGRMNLGRPASFCAPSAPRFPPPAGARERAPPCGPPPAFHLFRAAPARKGAPDSLGPAGPAAYIAPPATPPPWSCVARRGPLAY
ncbi:unnamed protein product [Amoebophrya sp. A120]|nr:unnamed protein product [Amoebophrya sp. A120]|eukprot:GSA120T00015977001.1